MTQEWTDKKGNDAGWKKLFAYEMWDSNPRSKLVYPALLSLEKRKNYLVVKSYAENPYANF